MGGTTPGQLPDAIWLVTGFPPAVWLFAALLVLAGGGRALVSLPESVYRVGAWALVGFLVLGAGDAVRIIQPPGSVRLRTVHPRPLVKGHLEPR
jgi:hypothetical protein